MDGPTYPYCKINRCCDFWCVVWILWSRVISITIYSEYSSTSQFCLAQRGYISWCLPWYSNKRSSNCRKSKTVDTQKNLWSDGRVRLRVSERYISIVKELFSNLKRWHLANVMLCEHISGVSTRFLLWWSTLKTVLWISIGNPYRIRLFKLFSTIVSLVPEKRWMLTPQPGAALQKRGPIPPRIAIVVLYWKRTTGQYSKASGANTQYLINLIALLRSRSDSFL